MLTGLGHGTIGRCDDEDRAVHLSSTRDHVLDVVCVAGAVDVRIVALVGLVLNVRGVDRDTTSLFLGRLIDLIIAHLRCLTLRCHNHGDSCGQSGLAVVNVSDRTDVDVGLTSVELSFSHFEIPPIFYNFDNFFRYPPESQLSIKQYDIS